MYKIVLILMMFVALQAADISSLLSSLEEKEAVYHKTKVESAGLLTLYTRSDLDRMQAYKLNALLKSLRYFSYKQNYVAQSALAPAGATSVVSSMFRLYIDNHEVSSAIYGSSMLQFGEMDLEFVDHVEIYQGGNAIAFGNEPGLVTIRLYSKVPKREKGTTLSILSDNHKSLQERFCYTKNFEKEGASLLMYGSHEKQNKAKVSHNSYNYSKDLEQNALYMKYDFNEKSALSAGYFQRKSDAFVGVGMAQTPLSPNSMEDIHGFINLKLGFAHNFVFENSIDKIEHNMLFSDTNKIQVVQNPQPFTYFDGKFNESIYKATLHQSIKHSEQKGIFKWGVQGIRKEYAISHMLMDGVNFSTTKGPSKLDILSLYAEESYNFNAHNLFIATLKIDSYHDNDLVKKRIEKSARIGYIHLFSQKVSSKLFYSQSYLYPGFAYTSTFPNIFFANPDLGAEHHTTINSELKYSDKEDVFTLNVNYAKVKDAIVFDGTTSRFINTQKASEQATFSLDATHHFNHSHTISAQIYNTYFLNSDPIIKSPTRGAYIRSFDTFYRWDLFNEVVYRNGYTYPYSSSSISGPVKIADGFDYTFGVQYHVNHALTFALKGENLLDKASKTPIYSLGGTNSIERRVLAKVEYFF